MELEFDKEMDALLRRAAGRSVLAAEDPRSHLDADAIAAFAENALPEKSRFIYTRHLATCDPCRTILAGLIASNVEAEPVLASVAATVGATSIPWYRKLFLPPNIAYVMGGLVLVFGGLFGLIVLQRSSDGTATLSKIEEGPATQNAPARAEGANSLFSANAASNSATNASGEIPRSVGVADSQPQTEANTFAAQPPPPTAASSDSAAAAPAKPGDGMEKDKPIVVMQAPKEAAKREDDERANNEVKLAAIEQEARKQDSNQVNVFRNQQNQMMPNSGNKAMGPSRTDIQRDNRAYDDNKMRAKTEAAATGTGNGVAAETRRAGGKIFELKQSAWYDTSYSGQKTRNVQRSSDNYRKLDAGLRRIADSIGGTVVIVWSGKAYRIQ